MSLWMDIFLLPYRITQKSMERTKNLLRPGFKGKCLDDNPETELNDEIKKTPYSGEKNEKQFR